MKSRQAHPQTAEEKEIQFTKQQEALLFSQKLHNHTKDRYGERPKEKREEK